MKKITLAIPLLFCLGATAYSQEQTPQLLLHAAQCLEAKKFLPSSEARKLTFGYLLDEKSYPGDRVIYVVKYAAPARSDGLVFAIFLTEHGDHQAFNIQNNARFRKSAKGIHGVDFVDPPLGGTWTQQHLVSAINEIGRQPRFTVPVADLLKSSSSTQCESYADSKHSGEKDGEKSETVDPKTGNVHLTIPIPAPTKKQ